LKALGSCKHVCSISPEVLHMLLAEDEASFDASGRNAARNVSQDSLHRMQRICAHVCAPRTVHIANPAAVPVSMMQDG
jgi:hypothetical protein